MPKRKKISAVQEALSKTANDVTFIKIALSEIRSGKGISPCVPANLQEDNGMEEKILLRKMKKQKTNNIKTVRKLLCKFFLLLLPHKKEINKEKGGKYSYRILRL